MLVLAQSAPARAGSFAPDGTFLFDPAAAAHIDFEDATPPDGATVNEDAGALSGTHVVSLPQYQGVDLAVTVPKTRSTYRVSAWIRDGDVTGSVEIDYGDRTSEVAGLYPTGRMTSDGWIEVANDRIRVDGARVTALKVGLFSAGGAVADAIEVVPDGDESAFPTTPNAA